MLISELIARLEYIKNIGGDLQCLFFQRHVIRDITPSNVIAVTNNGSNSLRDGVYFRVPDAVDDNENCIEVNDADK